MKLFATPITFLAVAVSSASTATATTRNGFLRGNVVSLNSRSLVVGSTSSDEQRSSERSSEEGSVAVGAAGADATLLKLKLDNGDCVGFDDDFQPGELAKAVPCQDAPWIHFYHGNLLLNNNEDEDKRLCVESNDGVDIRLQTCSLNKQDPTWCLVRRTWNAGQSGHRILNGDESLEEIGSIPYEGVGETGVVANVDESHNNEYLWHGVFQTISLESTKGSFVVTQCSIPFQ